MAAEGDFSPVEWGPKPFFATSLRVFMPLMEPWASMSESVCPQRGEQKTLPSNPGLGSTEGSETRTPSLQLAAPSTWSSVGPQASGSRRNGGERPKRQGLVTA